MTLDRICVSTWSFHTLFETGRMQVLDFPELIADRYGVHNLEIVAPHFGDAEPREVQARLDRAHSRIVNIPVDIKELWETPSLSSPDPAVSARAVAALLRVDRPRARSRCALGAMRSRPAQSGRPRADHRVVPEAGGVRPARGASM